MGIWIFLKVTCHLPTPVLDACGGGEGEHVVEKERETTS